MSRSSKVCCILCSSLETLSMPIIWPCFHWLGTSSGKAVLLEDVINNLSGHSDHYKNATLSFVVGEMQHKQLFELFREKRIVWKGYCCKTISRTSFSANTAAAADRRWVSCPTSRLSVSYSGACSRIAVFPFVPTCHASSWRNENEWNRQRECKKHDKYSCLYGARLHSSSHTCTMNRNAAKSPSSLTEHVLLRTTWSSRSIFQTKWDRYVTL